MAPFILLACLQQRKIPGQRIRDVGRGLRKVWPCADWVKGGASEEGTLDGLLSSSHGNSAANHSAVFVEEAEEQVGLGHVGKKPGLLKRKGCQSSGSGSVASGV